MHAFRNIQALFEYFRMKDNTQYPTTQRYMYMCTTDEIVYNTNVVYIQFAQLLSQESHEFKKGNFHWWVER